MRVSECERARGLLLPYGEYAYISRWRNGDTVGRCAHSSGTHLGMHLQHEGPGTSVPLY